MKRTESTQAMVEKALAKANEMAYSDYRIHAGMKRSAKAKDWENAGAERVYIRIDCYTLADNYKGNYKCGYIDNLTGQYVFDQYSEINLGI